MTEQIPFGYCQCGCGQKTSLEPVNRPSRGLVKGQPKSFVTGHHKRPSVYERFWAKVDKRGPDECWNWIGGRTGSQYGGFAINHHKSMLAHRYSWTLTHGEIPNGLDILHSCDNPSCVNPNHLFLGTQSDNMLDMSAKGRQPGKKLNHAQVRQIRKLRAQGLILKDISKIFGISVGVVSKIARLELWRAIR